jgi:hypothetical protein
MFNPKRRFGVINLSLLSIIKSGVSRSFYSDYFKRRIFYLLKRMFYLDFILLLSQIFKMRASVELHMNANIIVFLGFSHYNQGLSMTFSLLLIKNHIQIAYKMVSIR